LGITGTKSTPVSLIRLRGVTDHIKQSGRGKHVQVVYGNWSYEDGKEKTMSLLKRHKDINIIWAANDSMAMGAYDAAKELKYNQNISVGGLGGFPASLESIKNGGMKVTVGGTIMTGAWALVLLYDYHFGLDFIDDINANFSVDHNTIISTAKKADQFANLIIDNPQQIDFRIFTKKLNPQLKKYEFSYDKIVESTQ
jgi:ABC-type sugar transport system substrate-binding protein